MSRRGRRATVPGPGSTTPRGLLEGGTGLVVRAFAEDGSGHRDYDFGELPVAVGLRTGLARAFSNRVAPGAGLTSLYSMDKVYGVALMFVRHLSKLAWSPTEMTHLAPEHLDGFLVSRQDVVTRPGEDVATLKRLLIHAEGLGEALVGRLKDPNPRRPLPATPKQSYSRDEFKRIADAARADLRAAAVRIRSNRALLAQFRRGEVPVDADPRMRLLDWVDRFGDVPRRRCVRGVRAGADVVQEWVFNHGTVDEAVCSLHLSSVESTAGAVLLTAMTGQNKSVVLATSAAHHRADGYTGETATAILEARKSRRGRRAHMSLALSEIPDWISIPGNVDEISARDELHTPFGVYALLHELTARSRELTGSGRLLLGWSGSGGRGAGRGIRPQARDCMHARWAEGHDITSDTPDEDGKPVALRVTLELIRLTYLELHQEPVAHTEQTLATDYLARNRGNLGEYQKVVAAALTDEVNKARVRGVMTVLTQADLQRARSDAEPVAAEYGVDALTLKRMIAGELDTVMNACAGNKNSPQAPPGEPCRASFMLCLGCPCARALPRHLPIQVLVHDRLAARRSELTPLQWAQRLALPHAQIADLLDRHDQVAVDDARAAATDDNQALVTRFLNRELDLR